MWRLLAVSKRSSTLRACSDACAKLARPNIGWSRRAKKGCSQNPCLGGRRSTRQAIAPKRAVDSCSHRSAHSGTKMKFLDFLEPLEFSAKRARLLFAQDALRPTILPYLCFSMI
jgi:hypothetical protein